MIDEHPTAQDLLERYHDAMTRFAADDLADLYAEDACHEFPFFSPGLPDRLVGRDQVRATYRSMWANPTVRLRAIRNVSVYDGPNSVLNEWSADVELPDSSPFTLTGVIMLKARKGLIVHVRDYMDVLGVAHRTGRLDALAAGLRDA